MADGMTSGEIRTRRFDVARRGYDRVQVETFLAQVAGQFDDLENRIAEASERETSLGIDDVEAHARELETIGGEIAAILEVARSAAEAMRSRASADAESWTSDADSHVYAVRESAWVEGSAMLAAATEEVQRMLSISETDALRIRSEAEREAIRHTADAKRASEETIGAAENEAEGILSSSRAESERVLRSANQSATLAQERARALEDRRAELMVELESTRSSIGELESEIETKRQVLEEPEPVVVPEYEIRTYHETEGGSVKIVSGNKLVPLGPVDADSFVAEVAELHRNRPVEASSQSEDGSQLAVDSQIEISDTRYQIPEEEQPSAVSRQPSAEEDESDVGSPLTVDSREEPPESSLQLTADSSPPEEEQPSAVSRQPSAEEDESDVGSPLTVDSREEPPESSLQLTADSSPPEEEQPSPAEDAIGSLFAQLREDSRKAADSSRLTADDRQREGGAESAAHTSQSEEGSPAVGGKRTADGTSDAETGERTTENVPAGASLIPAQNAALRSIKRLLVDLQNDALEHLRTDEGWVPTEEFTDRFSEPFSELAVAITEDGGDGGAASVFATDLYDAVSSAVLAAREAGSGDRAIAAATSKVFRTWRSDEAERRVVAVSSDLSGPV